MKDALLISIRPGVLRSTAAVRAYFYLLYSGRVGGRKEEKEKDTKGRRKRRGGGKRGCREEKTGGGREGWKRWYFRASWPKESRAKRTCPEFETFDSRLPTFLPSLSLSFSPSVNFTVSPLSLSLIALMKFRHGWILRDTNFFRRETKSVFPAYPSIDLCRK